MLTESPLYGVPAELIAERCQVHIDTVRRWKRTGNAPAAACALIAAMHDYDLGAVAAAWAGWCVRGGDLVSPEGERFTPGLVRSAKYHRELAREIERERTKADVRPAVDFESLCQVDFT